MSRVRWMVTALAALGLMSCLDRDTNSPGGPGFGAITIRTAPLPAFRQFQKVLVVTQVRVLVYRYGPNESQDVLHDQTVPLGADLSNISLTVSGLLLAGPTETLQVELDYLAADGTVLFVASQSVTVSTGPNPSPTPVLQPFYIGPGNNVANLSILPTDSSLTFSDTLPLRLLATDINQQPVDTFYVSWTVSDPRVAINALGVVKTPDITKRVDLNATLPNGVASTTTLTIIGTQALGLLPDSVEKLPGGTQQFVVDISPNRGATFTWSVNGIDGGNSTVGTVDAAGFYTAPTTVPNPSKVSVCATDTQAPTITGCAVVVIVTVPSSGADLVVINDQNIFDLSPMRPDSSPGNARLVRNLVNFTGSGFRAQGTTVYYDRGRDAACLADLECADLEKATLDSVIYSLGYSIQKFDTLAFFSSFPPDVKVIVLWMPRYFYGSTEINALKKFAGEGGRIIMIGERLGFYLQTGIDVENQFLSDMGAQMTNVGADYDCIDNLGNYPTIPKTSIRSHPITQGVNSIKLACASEITLGPNDFALFLDTTNSHILAGVAKIDLTPLPAGLRLAPSRSRGPLTQPPNTRGTGR